MLLKKLPLNVSPKINRVAKLMQVKNQTRNKGIQWILVLYCLPCTNLHFTALRTRIARKTYLWQLLNKYISFFSIYDNGTHWIFFSSSASQSYT